MRLLALVLVVAAPALFAQARGGVARSGGARSGAPMRRPMMARPGRATAAPPVVSRGGAPVGLGIAPGAVYFLGYYPDPLYYGDAAPPPSEYGPADSGVDPNGGPGLPSVIVNPNYVPDSVNPVLRDYSNMPTPADAATPGAQQNTAPSVSSVYFLIAMKDHTIYPAIAYWVVNDTLNYINDQGVRKSVPLAQVDREFSAQLNKERDIDFALPDANQN